jgi:hypothetical protein
MKNLLAVFSILLLSACSSGDLRIISKPLEIDVAKAADPTGVQLTPVNFRVVTKETLSLFIDELSKTQATGSPVFIAMSMSDYENLTLNFSDLRRYIEQQQAVIVYYRKMTSRQSNTNQ